MKNHCPLSPKKLFPLIYYLTLLLVLSSGLPVGLHANGVWDGGGDGSSWEDPANWEGDLLPGSSDNICIPVGANVILNGSREMIRSLYISSEATFTVDITSSLTIMDALEEGITVEGSLLNMGNIFINYTGASGIVIKEDGRVRNQGSLAIDDVKTWGVLLMSHATFNNQASGSLSISRTREVGFFLSGIQSEVHNSGLLTISSTQGAGLKIEKNAVFHNLLSGEVNMRLTGDSPIQNQGVFDNQGILEVEEGLVPQQGALNQGEAEPLAEYSTSQLFLPENSILPLSLPTGPPKVPTMGEWALIVLALSLLSVATLQIGKTQHAFLASGEVFLGGLLLDKALFIRIFVLTLSLAGLCLGLDGWLNGSVTLSNIIGSLMAVSVFAYLTHLVMLFGRGKM